MAIRSQNLEKQACGRYSERCWRRCPSGDKETDGRIAYSWASAMPITLQGEMSWMILLTVERRFSLCCAVRFCMLLPQGRCATG